MLSTEGIFQKETILFCYLAEISPVERSQQNILYFPEGLVNRYVIYYHILSVKIKIKKDSSKQAIENFNKTFNAFNVY